MFFRCPRGKNLSVLKWSGDTDSESRRFQFGHGTNPSLSQFTITPSPLIYPYIITPLIGNAMALIPPLQKTLFPSHIGLLFPFILPLRGHFFFFLRISLTLNSSLQGLLL